MPYFEMLSNVLQTKALEIIIIIHITVDFFKGKGTQKYKCLLSESMRKTAHFDANCMEIGFLLLKLLRVYVFKMAANGGRHFEINIKRKYYQTQTYFSKACILIHI